MSGLTVLILAAENGVKEERWDSANGKPKQFIEIQGESILQRTMRLLGSYPVDTPYLLTTRSEFNGLPAVCWCPLQHTTKAHSVISSAGLWGEGDVLILYSDVYFTEPTFHRIMSDTGTRFYGREGRSAYTFKNYGEIFAVRISSADKGLALAALHKSVDHYERTGNQSFWVFYRFLSGLAIESKAVEDQYFCQVKDETDDIDYYHEVERLVAALEKGSGWWIKYFIRRISMLNKKRLEFCRVIKTSIQMKKLINFDG